MLQWVFSIFLMALMVEVALTSVGDRSKLYRQCLVKCYSLNCKYNFEFEIVSFDDNFFSWSCEENCRYDCMWNTVDHFTRNGIQVPQFHGKWPFIRIFGLQEPASVIFSLLNFYVHAIMYRRFRKEIKFSTPMSLIWTYFTVVCLNCWFWSAIFHARDKPFTEAMDYSCAFMMVVSLLYCMQLRLFYRNIIHFFVISCVYITVLITHLSYLWSENINYGYNMKMNIFYGLLTFIVTMIWWCRNSKQLPHINFIGWFNVLTVVITLLEVADFPPLFWIFDAHALWHACTAPITYLLYRFIILDCHYLRKQYSYQVIP